MKSSRADEVKGKLRQVKTKTKKELGELNDPTLEGKDENKIGRFQREPGDAEKVSKNDNPGSRLSVRPPAHSRS